MASENDQDAAMAAADKEMEERANRAKQLLSQRYRGLRHDQVRIERWKQLIANPSLMAPEDRRPSMLERCSSRGA